MFQERTLYPQCHRPVTRELDVEQLHAADPRHVQQPLLEGGELAVLPPAALVLGANGSFVARTLDVERKHLPEILRRAAAHKGSAFVEIYQNCNIFNDGAFRDFTDREVREDRMLVLQDGQPMVFGKDRDKGIRLNGLHPEVVQLGNGITEEQLLVHDETAADPYLAYMLSRMWWPEFPVPVGVLLAGPLAAATSITAVLLFGAGVALVLAAYADLVRVGAPG